MAGGAGARTRSTTAARLTVQRKMASLPGSPPVVRRGLAARHYLQLLERGLSVPQNLDRLCFQPEGPLVDEFDRLFASLFGEDRLYIKVVQVLARHLKGVARGNLLASVGLSSGGGAKVILNNLEEAGFVTRMTPFGRTSRDRFFRLTDEFSIFYLKWMKRHRPSPGHYWPLVAGNSAWRAWSGLAFESVCLKHAGAIKAGLGISGVQTSESSWLYRPMTGERGVQIDLLIDRADAVISLCELKYTIEPFTITKRYAAELRRKVQVFREQTRTRKATHLVFVTACGLTRKRYATELVDHTLTIDALFR